MTDRRDVDCLGCVASRDNQAAAATVLRVERSDRFQILHRRMRSVEACRAIRARQFTSSFSERRRHLV